MVTSKEIISYLNENLDKNTYISFFISGSLPEKLVPQSDLDLFFVIDETKKDIFFDKLSKLIKKYINQSNEKITYTFFRGPLKYKDKGLIHFLVYTTNKNTEPLNKELFINEHRTVLISLIHSAKVINGKDLYELTRSVDLKDFHQLKSNNNRSNEKYILLKKEGYINYPEWKKNNPGLETFKNKENCEWFLKELSYKLF